MPAVSHFPSHTDTSASSRASSASSSFVSPVLIAIQTLLMQAPATVFNWGRVPPADLANPISVFFFELPHILNI